MPRFRNYYNKRGKHNRIYSLDELYKMAMGDFLDKEDELDYQDSTIGLPFEDELKASKNVRFIDGFTQDDGRVIPSRWESFAPVETYTNPFDKTQSLTDGIAGDMSEMSHKQFPLQEKPETWDKQIPETDVFGKIKPYKNDMPEPFSQDDKLPDNTIDVLKQQPQEDMVLSDDMLTQNKPDIGQMKPFEDNKTQNIQSPQVVQNPQQPLGQEQEPLKEQDIAQSPEQNQKPVEQMQQQEQQPEQPKLSQNLSEYIDELLGKQNTPVYPENGILKGGVETTDIEDNVFRKPIEPIQDFVNKAKNNGTDYSVPKTNWEKVQEKIYTESLKNIFPMASNATKDGMSDFETAKKDINATIHSSLKDLNDKNLQNLLKESGVKDDMKGVHYSIDSNNSKIISKSNEIKEIVDDLCKNGGQTTKTSLDFELDIKQPIDSIDRYASIQHAKIHNPHISDDGNYMEGEIVDISDFEKRNTDNPINIPNNWGYNMQDKGQYKNYFVIIDIKVPLTEEQKKLLRQ